jgi:hypothetical protein
VYGWANNNAKRNDLGPAKSGDFADGLLPPVVFELEETSFVVHCSLFALD